MAARLVGMIDLAPSKPAFVVDSQAAIKALGSATTNSLCVKECRRSLQALQQHIINHYWVPGHCGVPGNEEADDCARKGSEMVLEKRPKS
ncbi:ribonuclease H-like [Rhagoletis pomonella]|uniref:ribonuclease H-like n=1 Tax=Rhagoletis pomonella TaxID=28610 RepID=UPI0017866586|nr:ribonuclease H-like [Rhagoletis pomonella]